MNATATAVRMDKWLWATRLYKTRSQAIAACENGRVLVLDRPVKPSRSVRIGDVITTVAPGLRRTVRVLKPIDRRVAAREVAANLEDLTPPEDYAKAREAAQYSGYTPRPRGAGRPNKKDRRALQALESPEDI
ncbi:MAG: RNA-binding S4 domain-containing protein [Verrucomicrobia bacterium]|nr:RNA-binding S4 domain-containing protein [Verrucomicrobiota bacterium]MBI3869284.1 RNA-binding S4 domain-containing protein [Verrucomicrobiota bacterium]